MTFSIFLRVGVRSALRAAALMSLLAPFGCAGEASSTPPEATSNLSGHSYDAIVVGSGYGGSVASLRLGKAGKNTLVLERGRWWTVSDPTTNATFPTLDSVLGAQDGRTSWLSDYCTGNLYLTPAFGGPIPCARTTGLLEVVGATPNAYDPAPKLVANGVQALAAAGVGGGSLINNGITYQPTKAGWDVAFPPALLPNMQGVWQDLSATYFAVARANLAPSPVPLDVLATPPYIGTATLDQLFASVGYPQEDPSKPATLLFGRTFAPAIVDWNVVRGELGGQLVPAAIKGEAWFGINSGAKKSLDKPAGYLGQALATGKVTIKALHSVTDIAYDPSTHLYSVTAAHLDQSGNTIETLTFWTKNLILSAGSLGTTRLLVRARDTGKLPRLSAAIGTHFSTNGNMAHLRIISPTEIPQGGPAGLKVTDFSDPANPVVIENLPQRVPPYFALSPMLAPLLGAVMTIGVGVPDAQGTFAYDASSGNVVLDWPINADGTTGAHNVYQRVTGILTNPNLPGQPVILPEAQSMSTTLHPLGGVPLGLATNDDCTIKGYPHLYAVDGSLLPGAGAVTNPSLTITALAERCMAQIVNELE